jgi:hypothetical protein
MHGHVNVNANASTIAEIVFKISLCSDMKTRQILRNLRFSQRCWWGSQVFCNVTPCLLVNAYSRFGRDYCFHLHGLAVKPTLKWKPTLCIIQQDLDLWLSDTQNIWSGESKIEGFCEYNNEGLSSKKARYLLARWGTAIFSGTTILYRVNNGTRNNHRLWCRLEFKIISNCEFLDSLSRTYEDFHLLVLDVMYIAAYQCSGRACCLHFQDSSALLD